jgi:DNA-directed RNA polymerase specialized sigma24 family protein
MTAKRVSVNTREERILLAAARAGDELAFGRLAARYRPGLELFCQMMLGCPHAAHDAVCETLVRGWNELRRGAPSACARIWLYRLATDVCLEDLETTDECGGPRAFDGVRDRNQRSP